MSRTMVSFLLFCTSLTRRALSYSARPANPMLSSRLQRLIEFVPADEQISSVADIGCDHGYVARVLAEERQNVQCVFAIDKSQAALKSALSELPSGVRQPSFLLGDGLSPLMPMQNTTQSQPYNQVNTIICAGMGCRSVQDILDPIKLETLKVQRLIIQPVPSYLLTLGKLTSRIMRLGYSFERQCVDFEKGEFYITTSFIKNPPTVRAVPVVGAEVGDGGRESDTSECVIEVFKSSPLYKQYAGPSYPLEGERRRWLEYLAMQMDDLEVRLGSPNRNGGRVENQVIKSYHELIKEVTQPLTSIPIAPSKRKVMSGSLTALWAIPSSREVEGGVGPSRHNNIIPALAPPTGPDPWFKAQGGLQFSCSLCGNCCSGSSGSVTFSEDEAAGMALKLGVSTQDFYSKYTRMRGRGDSKYHELKEVKIVTPNSGITYDCIFLDRETMPGKAICKLYKERPLQCKSWPFWPDILESEKSWKLAQKGVEGCPGVGKGEMVPYEEVVRIRDNSGV